MRYSLLIALTLMACQPNPDVKTADTDTCGSAFAQNWVGQTDAILRRMKFDPNTTRIIRAGDAVTMDFRQDRMNIEIDAKGIITRVYCG